MTQTMPPGPTISAALNTQSGGASTAASDGEFSGTFRKQFDQAAARDGQQPSSNAAGRIDESAASSAGELHGSDGHAEPIPPVSSADRTAAAPTVGFFATDSTFAGGGALALPTDAGNLDGSALAGIDGGALTAALPGTEPADTSGHAIQSPGDALAVTGDALAPAIAPTIVPGAAGAGDATVVGALVNGAVEPASALAAAGAAAVPLAPSASRGARAPVAQPLVADALVEANMPLDSGRGDKTQAALLNAAQANALPAKSDAEAFARVFSRAGDAATTLGSAAAAPVAAPTVALQTSGNAPLMPPPSAAVQTPLGDPGWGSALGARLVISAAQNMQSASIAINPRDLGPINVNMTVRDDELSMSFVAQHAPVREAIEAALPRLREMFSGEGVNLGEVDVSAGQGRDGGSAEADGDAAGQGRGDADGRAEVLLPETEVRVADGLIDTFA